MRKCSGIPYATFSFAQVAVKAIRIQTIFRKNLKLNLRIRVRGNLINYAKKYIRPISFGAKINSYLSNTGNIQKDLSDFHILFFDSLNLSEVKKASRDSLRHIFEFFQQPKSKWISFFLLEDYGNEGNQDMRQLIADCEFLSDVVIDLKTVVQHDYQTRAISIKKRRYGTSVHGDHIYKICPMNHALENVSRKTGLIIYPSIHHNLTSSRTAPDKTGYVQTGIAHLQSRLPY